jgi:hypothetical protein
MTEQAAAASPREKAFVDEGHGFSRAAK